MSIHLMVVFVFLCCHRSFADEPLCSKFSFEEALLEKMVRMEFKFGKLLSDFEALREKVKATQTRMSNEVQDIGTKFQDALTNLEAAVKYTSKERLNWNDVFMELQANLTESMATPAIGFKATELKDKGPSVGQVLVFSTVLFNDGNGYDSTTGVFTAPISGLYLFTVQVCTVESSYFAFSIMVDETEAGRFDVGDVDYYICDTGDAIVAMETGTNAVVKAITVNSSKDLKSSSDCLISFSGALFNKNI